MSESKVTLLIIGGLVSVIGLIALFVALTEGVR